MIDLDNLSYGYGDGTLIEGVTLTLSQGAFLFLTGPSGAGKTTLLRLCFGELMPVAGRLTIFGRERAAMSRDDIARARRRIGMVHQDCRFLDHLPVAGNVALPLLAAGFDLAAEQQNVAQLMRWVGLEAQAGALPPSLSGGERQRAALARALILAPEVILADEPTGNIDWEMSLRLLALLVELNRMGKTILLATHDLNLIRAAKAQVAARVLRIRAGRVELAGADL